MGAEFRDMNNDGRPDIFHTAMVGDTFPLYMNMGDLFEDITAVSGLQTYSRRLTAWSTGAFDFDNDGYKDLFTAGSAILDNEMEVLHRPSRLPNGLLRNHGNFTFTDVGPSVGGDFMDLRAHRGAAFWRLQQRWENRYRC
jgi:hypothetical protein